MRRGEGGAAFSTAKRHHPLSLTLMSDDERSRLRCVTVSIVIPCTVSDLALLAPF
jgi:hypothetical protein